METTGYTQANGRISGEVKTPLTNLPIEGVEVCIVLENDIDQSQEGTTYCDSTDAHGQYDIRRVYYHQEAPFKVIPSKENHGFDPAYFEGQILDLENPSISLNFKDTTSFIVSGTIYQTLNGDSCGFKGVEIWIDDNFKGTKTDKDGNYFISVEESGTYTIQPKFQDHTFDIASKEIFVGSEVVGVDFNDTTTHFLEGIVEGGCNIFIGKAKLRVYSVGDNGCIDTTFWTNDQGKYSVILPAREYELEVVQIIPEEGLDIDPDAVVAYFNTKEANLTSEGQKLDFIYRRPPEIKISGLPTNHGCDDLAKSIVEQKRSYQLEIEVRETFGNKSCPVEEGYILIYDEVSDKNGKPDSLILDGGKAFYDLVPGQPNIIAPYLKLLQIVAHVGQETSDWSEQLLVTGARAREQTFTTVLPEIPLMVLHDPPGDASYSYFEEGFSSELGFRIFGQLEGSQKTEAEVKLGYRQELGTIVSIKQETWGTIGGSYEVGARAASQVEMIMTQATTQQFSTSGNQDITGREGDVFVGAAMNLIYAQADVIKVDQNNCQVDKSLDVIMGNDGFATTFIYTEDHIKNSLIPQLIGLRNYYQSILSDSAGIYDNQINVWKQVLDNNDKAKRKASFEENRSFSAGATYASSTTSTSTAAASIELSAFIEASVAIGAGYEVAGSGQNGKVTTKLRVEIGAAASAALTKSTTTGFVLNDDDPGDFFSVNIKKDPVYGTPVFDLVSGRSSCPWEAGTQPRESLQLLSDSYVQNNVDAEGSAAFTLSLGNISQSDEPRTYILKFLQESNPNGAVVTIGGSQAQNPIPYTIAAAAQRLATVTVRRGPRAFNYEGLRFVLTSGCEDGTISDTVALSASFQSAYPSINLAKPLGNWVVNNADNNELLIRFLGYDKGQVSKVQLQYAPKGSYTWMAGIDWQSDDLSNATDGTSAKWNVSDLPDGSFDIRMRADYGNGDMYSIVSAGIIDRIAPQVFGLPEPRDGELDSDDVISVQFDEHVDCYSLSANQINFKSLTTGNVYPVEFGCADQKIIIKPLWNANQHIGEDIEIMIIGIKDKFNNISDTITWKFTIGNASGNSQMDVDEDGILDFNDNCTLTANQDQRDQDGDGIGDLCDDDLDGDGIPNNLDNCVYYANADQVDQDQNGVGDLCEQDADGDNDGINNSSDNCPFTANSDQEDTDGDGIGDICDDDLDGDGLLNGVDNCPSIANPDQEDTNLNSVGNMCETVTSTSEVLDLRHRISLAPNPANFVVTLQMDLVQQNSFSIAINDISGKLVWSKSYQKYPAGKQEIKISLQDFSRGVYFVRWLLPNEQITKKLIIVN